MQNFYLFGCVAHSLMLLLTLLVSIQHESCHITVMPSSGDPPDGKRSKRGLFHIFLGNDQIL